MARLFSRNKKPSLEIENAQLESKVEDYRHEAEMLRINNKYLKERIEDLEATVEWWKKQCELQAKIYKRISEEP